MSWRRHQVFQSFCLSLSTGRMLKPSSANRLGHAYFYQIMLLLKFFLCTENMVYFSMFLVKMLLNNYICIPIPGKAFFGPKWPKYGSHTYSVYMATVSWALTVSGVSTVKVGCWCYRNILDHAHKNGQNARTATTDPGSTTWKLQAKSKGRPFPFGNECN